jgi:hypothetical protein
MSRIVDMRHMAVLGVRVDICTTGEKVCHRFLILHFDGSMQQRPPSPSNAGIGVQSGPEPGHNVGRGIQPRLVEFRCKPSTRSMEGDTKESVELVLFLAYVRLALLMAMRWAGHG